MRFWIDGVGGPFVVGFIPLPFANATHVGRVNFELQEVLTIASKACSMINLLINTTLQTLQNEKHFIN